MERTKRPIRRARGQHVCGWLVSFLATVGLSFCFASSVHAEGTPIAGTTGPGTWLKLASMSQKQNESATALLGGNVYVIGGFGTNSNDPISRVQVYDPAADRWQKLGPMPLPRHSLAAAAVDKRIILPGGAPSRGGSQVLDYVDAFQPGN